MADSRPQDPAFARLAADEALYRSLVEDQTEFVVRWTPDGTRTFVNDAYCRYLGRTRDELVGTPFFGPEEDEERQTVLARLRDPEQGRRASAELQLSRGPIDDGRWHEWTDRAVYDAEGRIVEILSVGRDVHEKVLQRQALEESERRYRELFERVKRSEERYRSLFEDSRDAIVISDSRGVIEDANQAALDLFEAASKEDVVGLDALRFYSDPSQREHLLEQLTAQGFVRDFELNLVTRRGNRLTVLDTVTAAHDREGNLVGYRCLMRDVTEERKLAEQFRQSQKMDAIGRLAGGVAHDFNNLLTVIGGYSDLGLGEAPEADPLRQHFEQIQKAARRATDLTRQLLAFSRQQDLQPQRLDLNQVVGDFEELLRRSISEDILLETVFERPLGAVEADPGQMEQVIMNLVLNARDAMPQGGKLTVETRNISVGSDVSDDRYGWLPQGDYVGLFVSDTGCGMDELTRSRIFEPFFTTKERDKGTGLGLATVYGIVKQSGGYVLAYSEPGEGSVFKIYLPRADDATETKTATPYLGREAPALPTATVLVVDDEEAICSLAARVLEAEGLLVLSATSPDQALDVSRRHEGAIDLLLTDLVLPGMDGLQLAERLASERAGMALVVMSGYSDRSGLNGSKLPADAHFLGKPFSPVEAAQVIALALERRAGESAPGDPR